MAVSATTLFPVELPLTIHEQVVTSAAVPQGPRPRADRHRDRHGPNILDRSPSDLTDSRMAKRAKKSSNRNRANLRFEEKLSAAAPEFPPSAVTLPRHQQRIWRG